MSVPSLQTTTGEGPKGCSPRTFRRWQIAVLLLMVVGYSGFYFCRSDFSVSVPLIVDDFTRRGMDPSQARIRVGQIASFGVMAYALGKLLLAGAADFWGGKRSFLLAMGGAVLFTFVCASSSSVLVFAVGWIANRLVQSIAWAGMVKISSKWFSFASYGTAMAVLSLSFLFGDAAGRQFMGVLISHGLGWHGIFLAAGAILLAIFALNLHLLKESPFEIGGLEPAVSPSNLFGSSGSEATPPRLSALLAPLFSSLSFWLVSLLSFGCTLVRETFYFWTPVYFNAVIGFTKSRSAELSALFPLLGGCSVLLAGFLSDRLGRSGRAIIMFWGLLLTTGNLVALGLVTPAWPNVIAVILVSAVGLTMIGPYSFLAGAIALDFGGRRGSATCSAIIDGIGYLGGIGAGDTMARISIALGWRGAFWVLSGIAAVSTAAALALLLQQQGTEPEQV